MSGLVFPHLVLLVSTASASIHRWKAREEHIHFLSCTDVLTQVANRRHLMDTFDIELSRAQRKKTHLSLMMVDLDHFKPVNDNYGHHAGDIALKVAAGVLKMAVRKTDLVGRYGGEEFCIILPEADSAAAMQTAERCRSNLEQDDIDTGSKTIHITASFGLTTFNPDDEQIKENLNVDDFLKAADSALYVAKDSGRNQVITAKLCPTS